MTVIKYLQLSQFNIKSTGSNDHMISSGNKIFTVKENIKSLSYYEFTETDKKHQNIKNN